MNDRRKWTGPAVDAVLTYWLAGTHDDALREWWESNDAADCALELVHVVVQAIADAGFSIVPKGDDK